MVRSELRRWERELIDGDAEMDLGIKQAVSSITDDNERGEAETASALHYSSTTFDLEHTID